MFHLQFQVLKCRLQIMDKSNDKPIGTVTSTDYKWKQVKQVLLSYSTFMDKVVLQTQSYFTNVVNKNRETVKSI